eukprot:CAMPEP_0172528424 /NCGR_PEP_ID=MMETSP1067-20121228/2824_1 /TAXON_ID=265564 ORGANISM="Thalassiosira punctigera, Strain Tpunct2005C2" /NCGR_SAMPLE_ID=MMETSP1067 /ASSEMBLY_ACC=CAM_ASM_000444 /LENGTH=334 /DNA_ID=CAMNT_0013312323 /DNA_START=1 /DNA_END=1005 /DNA_ORIENTATION=+
MSKTTSNVKTKKVGSTRPYNRYNVWFILERERIILSKGGSTKRSTSRPSLQRSIQKECERLDLPPLPPRFRHLDLPANWCLASSTKRRPHRKTHGVVAFRELVALIASGWKSIDEETMEFCSAVEKALKQRHLQLSEKGMSENNATSPKPINPIKQLKPKNKPKQVKPKKSKKRQDSKPRQTKPLFNQAGDMSTTNKIAASLPTQAETLGNCVRQVSDVSHYPGDLSRETVSLSTDPTAPEIIKDFFGKGPPLGTNNNADHMDRFSFLAESIHAPTITNQSDTYFGLSNWAVMDDVPAPITSETYAVAAVAATDYHLDVNISDEDIRKMWHLQH